MRTYLFMIILSVIALNKAADACSNLGIAATGPNDCKDRTKPLGDDSYCCYMEGDYLTYKDVKSCLNIPKKAYKNVAKFIEDSNKEIASSNIKKLDCKSFYLHLSLINLILFLF